MNYGLNIRQEGALTFCPSGPSFTGWIQELSRFARPPNAKFM